MISETLLTPRERAKLDFAAGKDRVDNPYERGEVEYWGWEDAWREEFWKALEKPKTEAACSSKI